DRRGWILAPCEAGDARITVIPREHRGLVASLNQIIAEARAPLIARMDDDDICEPERFEKQIAFLATHPDHGVVGVRCHNIDDKGGPWPLKIAPHPETHEDFLAGIESGGSLLCHPGVMYRKDIVSAIGGYRAAFQHCEDYDLWLRLATV